MVIVHEFGHFIVAKKSGIWVQEFAVGMGPKVASITKGDTEYSIRVLPLGGFCRMEGENEDGSIPGPRSFLTKSVGIRFAVMFAGPLMNFILAFIMIFGLTCTTYTATPEIRAIIPESAAAECGMQPGDVIRKINGQTIHIYDELSYLLQGNQGEPIFIEVLGADGMLYKYELQPKLEEASGRYLIGFNPNVETGLFADPVEGYDTMTVGETMHYSLFSMFNYIKMTAEGLVRVFTFTAEKDEYGGPIAIFKTVEMSYEAGLEYSVKAALQNVIYIGAVLSANLGVLNLFPIPALDGGKILFLLIEAIRRKPIEPELEGRLQFLGFMFIMGLMVYVLFSDIMKFII